MKVVVTETIEHSADITVEMVEGYLLRRGYKRIAHDGDKTTMWRHELDHVGIYQTELDRSIRFIAYKEFRKPHEVLADIASGK